MGPFPHSAPQATISRQNPAGTDGFEFVEFAQPDPQTLCDLFACMGYAHTVPHKTRAIELWQQGDITYALNADPGSFGMRFAGRHGRCTPSMGWRVVDAAQAYAHANARAASPYEGDDDWIDDAHPKGVGFFYLAS